MARGLSLMILVQDVDDRGGYLMCQEMVWKGWVSQIVIFRAGRAAFVKRTHAATDSGSWADGKEENAQDAGSLRGLEKAIQVIVNATAAQKWRMYTCPGPFLSAALVSWTSIEVCV